MKHQTIPKCTVVCSLSSNKKQKKTIEVVNQVQKNTNTLGICMSNFNEAHRLPRVKRR